MTAINVALCTYGLSGRIFHQPFIKHHQGFRLHGVLERTKSDSLADNPEATIYRSLDELLADPAVDLVVVNSPNYLHFEYAKKALEARKHVIVEKPFTSTVAEAQELLQLAEEQGRFITVYHNRRYDSDFLTVKKVIGEGSLGNIIEAEFRFDRYKPAIGPKRFKEEPVAASGFLYDLGSHLADAAVALFGPPTALYADCRKVREGTAVDDFFEIVLHYNDKMRIRLLSGQIVRHPLPGFAVHGAKGSFIIERSDRQEELLMSGIQPNDKNWPESAKAKDGLLDIETKDGRQIKHISACHGNYMNYYDAVYNTIASNQPFPISADDIVLVIAILEAANKSSTVGHTVNL